MQSAYPKRKKLRLAEYDYSQAGYYFVTISSYNFESIFGDIRGAAMRENNVGNIVRMAWQDLSNHYVCNLDAFIIMPNHIHGIVVIGDPLGIYASSSVRVGLKPTRTEHGSKIHSDSPKTAGLSEIMRGFKTFSARRINEYRGTEGQKVWHRSFYDRILRREKDIENVRAYIVQNPQRWGEDRYNPSQALGHTK